MTTFTIPGCPVGKERPRVSKYGVYTPRKTKEYEKLVRKCFFAAGNKENKELDCPLNINIRAVFPVPASYSNKKKLKLLGTQYTHKPDVDNVAKIVIDALNGIAFKDDSRVSVLYVSKIYGEQPRVEVSIVEIKE